MRSKLGRAGWVLAVVTAFTLRAAAASDVKVEGDLKKMQGEWTATLPNGEEIRYTIKGDRIKAFAPNEDVEVTVTLDADAKPHKTMDGKIVGGGDDGRTVPAIYRFQGDDALVISYCPAEGAERPKDFEPKGDGQVVVTLVRKMAKGADAKPADAKAAAKAEAELKKMQGEWAGTTRNGDDIVYVFKGDRLTAREPNGEVELTIKLDPSARPNKAMEGTIIGGDEQHVPAIYKFDGDDKLVICFQHGAGAKRPREFEEDGDRQHVAKLTRRGAKAGAEK